MNHNPQRGDVVTAAGGPYSSKPRPVLIIQDPALPTGDSVVIMPFTSTREESVRFRLEIQPTETNGLVKPCFLEVDKVSAIRRTSLGQRLGALDSETLSKVAFLLSQLLGSSLQSTDAASTSQDSGG